MRVKLSYTVDEEDVLTEAANLLGLSAEDMQQGISLFRGIQEDLRGDSEDAEGVPNVRRALEKVEEFRKALLALDTRLSEVVDIVESYEEYRLQKRAAESAPSTLAPDLLAEGEDKA